MDRDHGHDTRNNRNKKYKLVGTHTFFHPPKTTTVAVNPTTIRWGGGREFETADDVTRVVMVVRTE